jgi:hypothetical protein
MADEAAVEERLGHRGSGLRRHAQLAPVGQLEGARSGLLGQLPCGIGRDEAEGLLRFGRGAQWHLAAPASQLLQHTLRVLRESIAGHV